MGYNVIAIDTGADKIQLCKDLGAKRAIDFKTTVRLFRPYFNTK